MKEDGSIDAERIFKLPIDEFGRVAEDMTMEECHKLISMVPIEESKKPVQAVKVDYGFDDERSGVDGKAFLEELRIKNNLRKKNA